METDKNENDKVFTVSELNEHVKSVLKTGKITVVGEVSNFKPSKTNVFFTLKDKDSMLNCVCWGYSSRDIELKNGDKINATGTLTVFTKSGTYNLSITKMDIVGEGDLHKQYEQLKKKYELLGLFSIDIKKKLPPHIKKIGVATAHDGAAIQDFKYILEKNGFKGTVLIKNCFVQGKDCPKSVVATIKELDNMNLDVIVITRGGGSFEDLFGFSDPSVVEAIRALKTPSISAIGHEVDFMLSDFVADIRAPTPSLAGELLCSHQRTQYEHDFGGNLLIKFKHNIHNTIQKLLYKLSELDKKLISPIQMMINNTHQLDSFIIGYKMHIQESIRSCEQKLMNLQNRLDSGLKRNCTVIDDDGTVITTIEQLAEICTKAKRNKKLKLIFKDGYALFNAKSVQPFLNEGN